MALPVINNKKSKAFQNALDLHQKYYRSGLGLQWHITNNCNWRCTHCYHETYQGEQPDLETMKDIFHQYLDLGKKQGFGSKKVGFKLTGGEPFVHPDILPFLEYIAPHSDRIRTGILTNGSLLTDEMLEFLTKKCAIRRMQISIEGDQVQNDAIRGEGAFDTILRAIALLKKYNISVHLGCTISKQNYKEVWNLLDLLIVYDIPILLRMLVPIGQSREDLENIVPPKELQKFHQKVREMNQKHHLQHTVSRAGREYDDLTQMFRTYCMSGIEALDYDGQVRSCGVRWHNGLTILPNLDVLACRLLPQHVLGNLKKESLESIFNGPKYEELTQLAKADPECQNCRVVDRCFGGAMCMSEAMKHDPYARDPQCWKGLLEKTFSLESLIYEVKCDRCEKLQK